MEPSKINVSPSHLPIALVEFLDDIPIWIEERTCKSLAGIRKNTTCENTAFNLPSTISIRTCMFDESLNTDDSDTWLPLVDPGFILTTPKSTSLMGLGCSSLQESSRIAESLGVSYAISNGKTLVLPDSFGLRNLPLSWPGAPCPEKLPEKCFTSGGEDPHNFSIGSQGHPGACAPACKFAWRKARGCKEGLKCNRCHLCFPRRASMRLAREREQSGGNH